MKCESIGKCAAALHPLVLIQSISMLAFQKGLTSMAKWAKVEKSWNKSMAIEMAAKFSDTFRQSRRATDHIVRYQTIVCRFRPVIHREIIMERK
jgi:hypothetical protein